MDWCDFSCESYLDTGFRVLASRDKTRSLWIVRRRLVRVNDDTHTDYAVVEIENRDGYRMQRKPNECAMVIPIMQADYAMCGFDMDWLRPSVGEDVIAYSFKKQLYVPCSIKAIDGTKSLVVGEKWKAELDTKFLYVDLATKGL